jgi:hypothetical protein
VGKGIVGSEELDQTGACGSVLGGELRAIGHGRPPGIPDIYNYIRLTRKVKTSLQYEFAQTFCPTSTSQLYEGLEGVRKKGCGIADKAIQ